MSVKAQLTGRALPSMEYVLPLHDATDATAALREASRRLREVSRKHAAGSKQVKAAQKAVDDAQAAVDACTITLRITALPPNTYEELVDQHPATLAQRKDDPTASINTDTFRPALLAACVEGDMTAADWADFLATRCSAGERRDLYLAVLGVNEQTRRPEAVLPKGLPMIQGWLQNST